uniref:Uncharacterized protein n=1 Tax=Anguilla anguilla TaxID=7936 RepID=A0A0E9UIQ4_ANGAN
MALTQLLLLLHILIPTVQPCTHVTLLQAVQSNWC